MVKEKLNQRLISPWLKPGVLRRILIKHELIKLCRSHRNEHITTMFDYYGMPDDTPGITSDIEDIYDRIISIEAAVNTDLNEPNCRFHFMLHEFEAVLFSRPESFALIADDEAVNSIRQIRASFASPEHINNSPDTAPSKRIEAAVPMYAKIRHGSALSLDMGLGVMLEECPHFRSWIEWIKSIAN